MSSLKGVVITQENQQKLMVRYDVQPEDTDQFPIGMIMIANWGDNGEYRYEGVLTQANFDDGFIKGANLQNGFFEVGFK